MRKLILRKLEDGHVANVLIPILQRPRNGQVADYEEMKLATAIMMKLSPFLDGDGEVYLEEEEWSELRDRVTAPIWSTNSPAALRIITDVVDAKVHLEMSDAGADRSQASE